MPSERIQRQIDALLDQCEAALAHQDWDAIAGAARAVLAIDAGNEDAAAFLAMAQPNLASSPPVIETAEPAPTPVDTARVAELEAAAERSGNPLDRLEEGVFVGRARELDRLREALDEAVERRGSVVMLVGEPGIGKTRTTQELDAYARTKRAQVLWGGAHETEGAPPYWPWVQLGRAYRDVNPEEIRRKEWEPYAVELQRLFNLRALFPNLPEPPAADSEEAQFRLFDAMAGFLRGVSERTPLLLVLDDLHWADTATLQLLAHVGREIGRARILVLGTYRDTDLDRRHPLSRALAQMNREALFSRIALRGLAEPEVGDYLRRTAGIEPERALVHRIFEETEGNPFFLAQVVNLMAQDGTLTARLADVQLPEGVREALGRRLDRLSEQANTLLTTLAVAGREFDHPLAEALSGHDAETTLALLEEALRARVLEELGPGAYRFTHALMQETLLGELSAARQVLLHGRIAEAFETLYGPDDRDHLAALASHYAESAALNRDHAGKAVRYLRLAADQSMAALGYDDAARLYERCLAIIEQAREGYGEDEAELWAALALCRKAVGDYATGREALERALALFTERGDARSRARVWEEYAEGQGTAQFRAELPLLNALITALGDADSLELCRVLAVRALLDPGPDGDADAARAEAIAERLGLVGAAAPIRLTMRMSNRLAAHGAFREAVALLEATQAVPGSSYGFLGLHLRAATLAWAGDVEGWLASRSEYLAEARTYRRPTLEARAVADLASIAWRRGERAQVEGLLDEVDLAVDASALFFAAAMAVAGGDPATALRLLPADDHPGATEGTRLPAGALHTQMLFLAGDREAARTALGRALLEWERMILPELLGVLANADAALAALAEDPDARLIAAYLDRIGTLRCYPGGTINGGLGNPDVLRGALALRFGEVDEAERHFRTGLEWASRPDVRFILDQGRCLQGLAEVAERRGDLAAAREHLESAGALFVRHGGARLYLDQVRAKQAVLRA